MRVFLNQHKLALAGKIYIYSSSVLLSYTSNEKVNSHVSGRAGFKGKRARGMNNQRHVAE